MFILNLKWVTVLYLNLKLIMKIPVIIYKDEDGILIAESPVLPGFHTYWKDEYELFKNLKEVTELYKELIENGEINIII